VVLRCLLVLRSHPMLLSHRYYIRTQTIAKQHHHAQQYKTFSKQLKP
jgi:hypothetical protein